MQNIILSGIIVSTYLMVMAKRANSLVRAFAMQSFFLFGQTVFAAIDDRQAELFIVAVLLLAIKVIFIPFSLNKIIEKIKAGQDLGLLVNSQLSLLSALFFNFLAWIFSFKLDSLGSHAQPVFSCAFFVVLTGSFLMISRITALSQIAGLLVMENGLFLFASSVSGGMPFFVEIAIFFDVFISVLIMGFFVYRINKLFTHIDVNKLKRLRG